MQTKSQTPRPNKMRRARKRRRGQRSPDRVPKDHEKTIVEVLEVQISLRSISLRVRLPPKMRRLLPQSKTLKKSKRLHQRRRTMSLSHSTARRASQKKRMSRTTRKKLTHQKKTTRDSRKTEIRNTSKGNKKMAKQVMAK